VKVADLMTREVRACTIHESVNAAARIMWEHDCGCALVVDGHGKLAGIVTDRDICMAAYTQGVPLEGIPVERVMSPKVISCSRSDDLETAHQLMRTHEIHRIPVVDSRGRPVGILSLSDLVNHKRGDLAEQAAELVTSFSTIRRRREPVSVISTNGNGAGPHESIKPPKKASSRRKKPAAELPQQE
jgi:CBS domain-containing protein